MQKNNNKISYQKNNIMWTIFIISFFILLYFLNSSLEFNKPEDAPIGVVYEIKRQTNQKQADKTTII